MKWLIPLYLGCVTATVLLQFLIINAMLNNQDGLSAAIIIFCVLAVVDIVAICYIKRRYSKKFDYEHFIGYCLNILVFPST